MKSKLSNTAFFATRLHAPLASQYSWGTHVPSGVFLRVWQGDILTDNDGTEWANLDYIDLPAKKGPNGAERRRHCEAIIASAPAFGVVHRDYDSVRRYDGSTLLIFGNEWRDDSAVNGRYCRIIGRKSAPA